MPAKYEQLFAMYAEQRRAFMEYERRLGAFVGGLVEEFRRTAGLPESFVTLDNKRMPWVALYNLVDAPDEEQFPDVERIDSPYQLHGLVDGAFLDFGIGVAISASLDSFPRNYFWLPYRLSRTGGVFLLEEKWSGGTQRKLASLDDASATVASFFHVLEDSLSATPEQALAGKKSRIGFIA